MINLQKGESKQTQHAILSFASPAITPSNNYKRSSGYQDQLKDANSSIIMGRKIDSPQLRVGKDLNDLPQSSIQGINAKHLISLDTSMRLLPFSFHREDLVGANYQVNLLNQTNKDIQKKQFDFNIKQPKANVTIQYDSHPRGTSAAHKQQKPKHAAHQSNKRQMSQSATHKANQPSNSIPQPLINLHIANVRMSQQPKIAQQMRKHGDLKFASGQHQVATKSKHRKNKSEIKAHKGLSKSSLVNKHGMKRHHNREQVSAFQDGLMFSFENKENQSMNMLNKRELTPNTKPQKHELSISSISSSSPQKVLSTSGVSHNKKYYMDKSSFLKHLSPEKSTSKTRPNKNAVGEQPELFKDLKSNVSTITHQQTKKKGMKIKRAQTSNNQAPKLFVQGVDKIIKQNLKKNKSKEEEEILKKYMEDYKQKQKRVELSQRNQEVRKINASKIISNHQHKHSQVNQALQFQNMNYKKQRSKSCMSKTDNIFVNMQKKDNKLHVQILQQQVPQVQQPEEKREKKREKSFVLEFKELKKEIDQEIKKEIMEGKLDIVSASNKRANLSTIHAKPRKPKEDNQKSKDDIFYYQTRQRKKSKQRESIAISQNIQKFIDRKKKAQMAKKSMEQTLEHEKHLKIKENLHNLNRFVKQHFRQQSQNIFIKKLQPKGQNQDKLPTKKLKPHFYKIRKGGNEESKLLDLDGEMMFDHKNEMGESYNNSPDKYVDMSEQRNDYSVMLKSMLAKAKNKKVTQKRKRSKESLSAEHSPNKNKQQEKGQRVLKMKLKVPRAQKQDSQKDLIQEKYQIRELPPDDDSSPDYQSLMTAIKNEVVPKIPEDQVASLIPPQSDIATLDYPRKELLSELKKRERSMKMQNLNQKSPETIENQRKQKVLLQKYGQANNSQSDTKFLIKLHSSAITIQQQYRKHLAQRGFYNHEIESQMYVDSELEGDFNYQLESGYQMTQLNAISLEQSRETTVAKSKGGYEPKMSPLRVKNFGSKEFQDSKKDTSKFYGEGNKDQEKVIVCSVINTGRPEEDDSLQNTQQYIPLRQKQVVEQKKVPSISVDNKSSSYPVDLDQSSSSQRKNLIPSLDLGKLKVKEIPKVEEEEHKQESSARNIFERNPFQEFSSKVHQEDFNMNQYPELLKLREEAIKYKEQTEHKYITKMYKAQQFSPRTYERKRQELEMWVTKEREEVKKSRKNFEKQWQKASDMIDQTQKEQDRMMKLMVDSGRISLPSKREHDPQMLSQRILSSRREPTLLDMIYENKEQGKTLEKQLQEHIDTETKKRKALEEQKAAETIKQQKELEEQQRQQKQKELERKQKEDEVKEKERQEKLKKEKEEEERKIREAEKKQQEELLKKQREEVEKRRKEEEALQRQKDLEEQRKQEHLAKLRREEEERAKKVREQKAEEERSRKEAEQRELQRKKQIEEEKIKQEQREEREKRNAEIQKKLDSINQKFSSNTPSRAQKESFSSIESLERNSKKQNINQVEDELKSEPDMDMMDDHKDIFSQENQLISQILRVPSKKQLEGVDSEDPLQQISLDKFEEPSRGLSRTRSSQDLKDNKDNSQSDEHKEQSDPEEVVDLLKGGLHEKSIDEDQSTKSVVTRTLNQKNFFTKNFDDEKAEDLFEKYKNSTTELQQIIDVSDIQLNEDLQEEEKQSPTQIIQTQKVNKIYIEDKGEEIVQPIQNPMAYQYLDERSRRGLNKSKIPADEEEKLVPGMPVSPASMEGADLRIQTGSQSLESTLSDEKKLKQAIQEAQKQDKQDEKDDLIDEITEDIFKALMAEMRLELDLLLIKDPRKLFKEDEQPPHNYFLSESGRFLIFERKGIKTDLFAIEKYVEEVLEEVLRDKNRFIININSPLSKKALEVLNQLQNSTIGSYEHFEVNYPNILPLDMYLKLEKRRKESRERERLGKEEGKDKVDKNFLAECEHIHNKVLFDCINDSLLQFKPYGKEGVPLPWSRQSRRLKPIEDFTIEEMFEIVKHDLFRWAIMQAGTLPRKEFVYGGVFDDELFAEIREKKLTTLLAREMIENEPKWLNYEFEEAQVKIDIGDMILEHLVKETIHILNNKVEL